MKRNLKILGLAVTAVLAFAALSAASASASQPEFVLESGTTTTFTGSGSGGTLETVAGRTVTCTSTASTGEINSAKTVKGVVVTFKGCTASFGLKCTTSGQTSGTIVTKTLKGELAYYESGEPDTGVLLEPESGTVFATFVCGGLSTVTVEKEVGGVLTPVNGEEFKKEATLTFTQTEGVQSPSSYLSPETCEVEPAFLETKASGFPSFGLEQSAVSGTETLKTAVGVKVVASECT